MAVTVYGLAELLAKGPSPGVHTTIDKRSKDDPIKKEGITCVHVCTRPSS